MKPKPQPEAGSGPVRSWHLDLVGIAAVVYLVALGVSLAAHPSSANIVALIILAYVTLRIGYEFTFNRGKVPTLASGFFERRKIAHILKQDAVARGLVPYTVIDLGSGRGELTRRIARAIPQAHVTGIELARLPYLQSCLMQKYLGPANLDYKQLDFFAFDCTTTNAIVMYLSGKMTKQVGEKLSRELKSGSLVITCEFELLGDWKPIETVVMYTPFRSTLFVYRKT